MVTGKGCQDFSAAKEPCMLNSVYVTTLVVKVGQLDRLFRDVAP